MENYQQDDKLIEKKVKYIDSTVTVSDTTNVNDAASTEEYHIIVKEATSVTIVTYSEACSDEEVPATATICP